MRKAILILIPLILTAACLTADVRHTLYIEPDGALTWSAWREDVRSDEKDPDRGAAEEREWLDRVRNVDHDLARAFRLVGADRVDARIVRDERPYTVVTQARFRSVDVALEELFRKLGLPAEAQLVYEGDHTRLMLRIGLTVEEREGDSSEEQLLTALLPDSEGYRFVLTHGRFVEAQGFELDSQDTVAVMLDPEDDAVPRVGSDERLYVLTWTTPAEPHPPMAP